MEILARHKIRPVDLKAGGTIGVYHDSLPLGKHTIDVQHSMTIDEVVFIADEFEGLRTIGVLLVERKVP